MDYKTVLELRKMLYVFICNMSKNFQGLTSKSNVFQNYT